MLLLPLSIALAGDGQGSVTGDGIACTNDDTADCHEIYNAGTMVTLKATAVADSVFVGWSGTCCGTGDCVVTMDVAQSVTATFDFVKYHLYLPILVKAP